MVKNCGCYFFYINDRLSEIIKQVFIFKSRTLNFNNYYDSSGTIYLSILYELSRNLINLIIFNSNLGLITTLIFFISYVKNIIF
jgi:hypothetical protein